MINIITGLCAFYLNVVINFVLCVAFNVRFDRNDYIFQKWFERFYFFLLRKFFVWL